MIAGFYLAVAMADFLSPYDYREQSREEPSAPAATWRFRDAEGNFSFRPFVFRNRLSDPVTRRYQIDESQAAPIRFFVRGYSYRLLGIIPSDLHLAGVAGRGENVPRLHLLGTDSLGRDRFSRLLQANRFSLLVAPAATFMAAIVGILIGIVSGFSGRLADSILMGITDTVLSLPTLIIVLAARAAFPLELPPPTAAALLIGIFALSGWAEIARLARGLVKSTTEREFIMAATAVGVTPARILLQHILPNISRPLMTQAILMLPAFLLAESALSFLGVGLQEPEPSLGNLLAAAVDLTQLSQDPFLVLSPAVIICGFVLVIRLLSDGLLLPSKGESNFKSY